MRPNIRILSTLVLSFAVTGAAAQDFILSVDVPAELGRDDYMPSQTVRHDAAEALPYSVQFDGPAQQLGPDVNIDGVFQLGDAEFLFSVDTPQQLGGTLYGAADVILHDGQGGFSLYLGASDLRLPADADIDALALDPEGRVLFSLDAPAEIGATLYGPEDILFGVGAQVGLHVDGSQLGIPPGVNVIGYDETSTARYFSFDIAVDLDGQLFIPGDIALHDGGGWSLWFRDGDYPPYAVSTDLSLLAPPGEVDTLLMDKSGSDLVFAWTDGCQTPEDYAVFEGVLGQWSSHEPAVCSTGGSMAAILAPGAGSRYYLVVPLGGGFEGSYGADSFGSERGQGGLVCESEQRLAACM